MHGNRRHDGRTPRESTTTSRNTTLHQMRTPTHTRPNRPTSASKEFRHTSSQEGRPGWYQHTACFLRLCCCVRQPQVPGTLHNEPGTGIHLPVSIEVAVKPRRHPPLAKAAGSCAAQPCAGNERGTVHSPIQLNECSSTPDELLRKPSGWTCASRRQRRA